MGVLLPPLINGQALDRKEEGKLIIYPDLLGGL